MSNKADDYNELKWNAAPPLDHASSHISGKEDSNDGNSSSSSNAQPTEREFLPLHAETTALLVVDVQPEYWSQCPAVRKDFPDFEDRLKSTVQTCRNQGVSKIIWVRADYRLQHSPWLTQFARLHGISPSSQKKEPEFRTEVVCDPTDFNWEPFAQPAGGEIILPKTSWSSTTNTGLNDILQGVDTVLVCGLITSVCVQHSAFGVFEAGYRTILVTDACADRGRARHDAALALYGDYMYELISSRDLASTTGPKRLQAAKPVYWPTATKGQHGMTASLSSSTSDTSLSSMSASSAGPKAWQVVPMPMMGMKTNQEEGDDEKNYV